jgi:hypothetical protein
MDKMLHIENCCFKLPEDFDGTLGEALLMLANYRLEKEQEQAVKIYLNKEEESDFWNGTKKGIITYSIDTKERIWNYLEEKTNIK